VGAFLFSERTSMPTPCKKCGNTERYKSGDCATCAREYNRRYYQANKERKRQYYQNNLDKIKEYKRRYYQANLEKFKEYYQDNAEAIKQRQRQYQQVNLTGV
jgi:predicted ATP-dependent serine protease